MLNSWGNEFGIVEPPVKLFKCYEIFLLETVHTYIHTLLARPLGAFVLHVFCIHTPFKISERGHNFIFGVQKPGISVFVMVTNDLLSLLPALSADRLISFVVLGIWCHCRD